MTKEQRAFFKNFGPMSKEQRAFFIDIGVAAFHHNHAIVLVFWDAGFRKDVAKHLKGMEKDTHYYAICPSGYPDSKGRAAIAYAKKMLGKHAPKRLSEIDGKPRKIVRNRKRKA